MSSPAPSQQAMQPPKPSRYRSARKAAAALENRDGSLPGFPPPPVPQDAMAAKTQESIKRSMSRYRRARPDASKAVASPPPLPTQLPTSPNGNHDVAGTNHHGTTAADPVFECGSQTPESARRQDLPLRNFAADMVPHPQILHQARGEASPTKDTTQGVAKLGKRVNEHQEMEGAQSSRHEDSRDNENGNGRAHTEVDPLSPMYQEYMSSQQDTQDEFVANAMATAKHNNNNNNNRHQQLGGLKKPQKEKTGGGSGLLSRLKGLDAGSGTRGKDDTRGSFKNMISAPQPVDPLDVDKAPADDTPISAVNASERKVLVICNESFVRLPVTPSTDTLEILCTAAGSLDEDIVPESSTLTEYFKQLGLERPLRKYERVRGVMNSWDSDSYNHLIVTTRSDESEEEAEELLEARYAPREQPSESSFQLYYAQKRGKWEKRRITLKPDGQVSMVKKGGEGATNICHMSDFDIYSLTRRETRKLKPPKRFCYAVKSQQKSSMFLTTENFVHYFSTGERDVARSWYTTIQQWRSWYLVNMLGAGNDSSEGKGDSEEQGRGKEKHTASATAGKKTTAAAATHRNQQRPTESGRRSPGSARPSQEIEPTNRQERQTFRERRPGNSSSALRSKSAKRVPPPCRLPIQEVKSYPSSPTSSPLQFSSDISSDLGNSKSVSRKQRSRKPQAGPAPSPPVSGEEEPFARSGLLGRTYTERQNAMREREKEADRDGPSARNGLQKSPPPPPLPKQSDQYGNYDPSRPRHGSSVKETAAGAAGAAGAAATSLEGTSTTRRRQEPQKPLVDLTPSYMEPPQHARKGRGIAAEPGGLLVDSATGPDLAPGAIAVPSATIWRRQGQRSGTVPGDTAAEPPPPPSSSSQQHQHHHPGGGSARQRSDTFRSQQRQAPGRTRAEVAQSTPASPDSPFAPTGLVARSARANTTQGAIPTGRGVATGDRNAAGKPLLDMSEMSQFAEGSLLRSVEQQGDDRSESGEPG